MPKRKAADLVIPDISQDPAERKRLLNILAQRRYREIDSPSPNSPLILEGQRRADHLRSLEAQVKSRNETNEQDNDGSSSSTSLQLDLLSNPGTPTPANNQETGMSGPGGVDAAFDLDMSCLNDPFVQDLPSPFASLASPSLLNGPDTVCGMSMQTGQNNPTTSPTLEANQFTTSLQDHQTSTFTFPDDRLLDVPSLTLLNAAAAVAVRLNINDCFWDIYARSPFFIDNSVPPIPAAATVDLSALPSHLLPTPTQQLMPHHPILDLLPWPATRDKLIQVFHLPVDIRPKTAQDPLGIVRFVYDMEDPGGQGVRVRGDNPFDVQCWEIGQLLFERWWWAFDGAVLDRSNCERLKRGEKVLEL